MSAFGSNQKIRGNNNTQVVGDYTTISIYTGLAGLDGLADLDSAIEKIAAGLHLAYQQLGKIDSRILIGWYVTAIATTMMLFSLQIKHWPGFWSAFSIITTIGLALKKPITRRRLIKVDIEAHQSLLTELTKRKIINKIES